jgi:hypothetical protein
LPHDLSNNQFHAFASNVQSKTNEHNKLYDNNNNNNNHDYSSKKHKDQGALSSTHSGDSSNESESESDYVDTDDDIEDIREGEEEETSAESGREILQGIQHQSLASKSPTLVLSFRLTTYYVL